MPRATEPAIIGAIGRLAGAFGLMLAATLTVASVAAADDSSARGENDMALLVDRARVAAGLLPLARSQALTRAAQAHAQDMAVQEYMEHEGLDGSTPASRAASEGYATPPNGAWLVVEVISARGDPPQAALDWWLGDGLHRRVVMRSTWRELGIGYAQGGPYGRFWVVLFGCRPNVLPPVLLDGTLSIPDESCGSAPDTFGHVQATRAAQTADATKALDWEPYVAERDWPPGQPAVVHLRDGTGRVLEVTANDPATPTTELP